MKKLFMLFLSMLLSLVVASVSMAYTLDLGTTTTDMTTIGGVILGALGLLAGFALIVRMVRKAG